MRSRRTERDRRGFTLLELIVVLAIMAILAGAAIPVATMAINSKARRATEEELRGLQAAAAEYFRDVGQLPAAISDMEINPGVTGWSGPYLQAFSLDSKTGLSQYSVDAWSTPYRLISSTSELTLVSAGNGATFGDENDLSIVLDVTLIRREKTLEQLGIVNMAISKYNAAYLGTDPLPSSYDTLLRKLVLRGYLPDTAPYQSDGWGDPFQASPPGKMPVVKVESKNVPN